MTEQRLSEQRLTWQQKPVLRAIYTDYYRRVVEACIPGPTLEIGGGSGNLKEYLPDVVSTDLVPTEWLDAAADAQALPFTDECFANIVCVDVLHHIERPRRFLAEASRTLRPGGRFVLLEPAITPVSWVFYHLMHPEPVDMGEDPLADGPLDPDRVPFDANQAIPTLLLGRHRDAFEAAFPELEVHEKAHLSLIAYPLSGGFRAWSLVPAATVPRLLSIEQAIMPVFGPLMAFRLLAVLRKRESSV